MQEITTILREVIQKGKDGESGQLSRAKKQKEHFLTGENKKGSGSVDG